MKYIQHHLVNVLIVAFIVVTGTVSAQKGRQIISFNADWQFSNLEDFKTNQKGSPLDEHFNFDAWERVSTPHTAKIEPLVVVNPWIGESWYKKDFIASNAWRNKKVFLHFEAVMQVADVWLNGKHLVTHTGGYLPFTVDISNEISFDKANRIIVKTFNGDNGEIPPGKPIKELDFCYFSGIYRNVSLVVAAPLHITDAVQANATASGGVRIWYPTVSEDMAELAVKTHIRNEDKETKEFVVDYKLADKDGYIVNSASSKKIILTPESEINVFQQMEVTDPDLWHPDHPTLYTLSVSIKEGGTIVDALSTRTGIRKFEIVDSKLMINGTPFLLVGTNRHQEYPYIGNALSDNAQYRDAVKIKEAGFWLFLFLIFLF
jgi:beta-galactosidase